MQPDILGFGNRAEAGRRRAQRLMTYAARHPVVLALPRGGVPVAFESAWAQLWMELIPRSCSTRRPSIGSTYRRVTSEKKPSGSSGRSSVAASTIWRTGRQSMWRAGWPLWSMTASPRAAPRGRR
jgi:hypothetical protein